MKALILSFLLWCGLITPPPTIVISGYEPGGEVGTYINFFDREARAGNSIMIDGACVSACTFFLASFTPDRICITHRASLGVHQALDGDTNQPDPVITVLLQTTFYPEWLQDWIKAYEAKNGVLTIQVVYIGFDELKKHYRVCDIKEAPISGANGI